MYMQSLYLSSNTIALHKHTNTLLISNNTLDVLVTK